MEIKAATQEEIVEFKTAAAARYAEAGVPPHIADQLFENQMAKVAAELNLQPVKSERVEKIASMLAEVMGVKRAGEDVTSFAPFAAGAGAAAGTPGGIGTKLKAGVGAAGNAMMAPIQHLAGAAGKATAGIKTPDMSGMGAKLRAGIGAAGNATALVSPLQNLAGAAGKATAGIKTPKFGGI